jgi:hypothetical protein
LWHVPESRDPADAAGVDRRGALLVTLGLAGLACGLSTATELGWAHPVVLGAHVAGTLVLALFVWAEAHAPLPIVLLGLFGSSAFSGANAVTLLLCFAMGGALGSHRSEDDIELREEHDVGQLALIVVVLFAGAVVYIGLLRAITDWRCQRWPRPRQQTCE